LTEADTRITREAFVRALNGSVRAEGEIAELPL
jgi:hypothetical protein